MVREDFTDATPAWKALQEQVREVNLSYLLLVQRMVREDKATAMFRLGIAEDLADILARLSLSQLLQVASLNQMQLDFRLADSAPTLKHLARGGLPAALSPIHAAILMSTMEVEGVK